MEGQGSSGSGSGSWFTRVCAMDALCGLFTSPLAMDVELPELKPPSKAPVQCCAVDSEISLPLPLLFLS